MRIIPRSWTILRGLSLALALTLGSSGARAADTIAAPSLNLDGARRALAAALSYARKHDAPGAAVAVVDAGGHTILVERLDGTFLAAPDISIGKARTAVNFRRPTRELEDIINKGRNAMTPVAEITAFTPLQGGVPILVHEQVVGGVGVSGAATAQQDDEIATAAAQALADGSPLAAVLRFDAGEVQAAYGKGEAGDTLIEQPGFRVNASRRDGPGQAEIHERDTDIFYVVAGNATVMTGGELIDPQTIASGEIRGSALRGGNAVHLAAGDVLTIPQGTPHWFRAVTPPFRYFVVKSASGG